MLDRAFYHKLPSKMPEHCAAYNCSNRRTIENRARGITFHKFPKDKDFRKKWEVALRRERFIASDSSVLCSEHFKQGDFDRTGQIVRLRDGVIPSILSFPIHLQRSKKTRPTSRRASQEAPVTATSHPQPQPNDEHGYALLAAPTSRKAKLNEALARVESLGREKKNSMREKRAKTTVKRLLGDLRENNLNEELKERQDMEEAHNITAVYAEVCGLPTPVSAHVSEEQHQESRIYTVTAEWSQSDLVRCSRLRYSQQWTLIADSGTHKSIRTVLPPGLCVPVSGELLSGLSPIQNLRAVIRETSGHHILEIWDCHGLRKCLNLTALHKHGKVYDDAQFGCLSWSVCANKLLYIAEKNKDSSAETQDGELGIRKDSSVYCEDWGEALTNRSVPVICAVDLRSGMVSVLQGVPHDVSPGQALWAPDSQSVFFIGWYHEPFRLGLKFCSNRRSALFKLDLNNGHCECLSGDNISVSCPRLSPDGSTLIHLQGGVFGPHNQCLSLQQVDLKTGKTSTLLDVINRPQAGEFAGFYEALPVCCWSTDSQRMIFSSARRNWKDLFMFDRRSKKVTSLSDNLSDPSQVYGSWKLLTIQGDLMIVSCSSPNTPPTLRVGFLPSAGEAVTWRTLQQPVVNFDFHWTILDVTPSPEEDNTSYSGLDFGAVLVKPSRPLCESSVPLIVFSHGGPHSQFPAEWNSTTAGLAKLGFAVLMVNYRGSTGFGQDNILSLIGQIGNQDVKDVQRAVLTTLQHDLTLDPKRLAVIGGSHGGFLSCHLLGQYPDFYRACAARNPVINAATLLGTSDIVDWRYTSAGFQYSYDQIPTAEVLAAMLQKSPITHAAQIKAPVLLMLGGRDRRVSPHQGLELYKVLKSRGSPVRLLWFPEDGHSLSRVDTQFDCFLNTVLWLQQHL